MTHSERPDRVSPAPRTERTLKLFGVMLVAVAVLAAVALWYGQRADQRSQDYKDSKTAAVQALGTANSSLTRAGLPPVPTPTVAGPAPTVTVTRSPDSGPAGPTGATGPGPSQVQIQNAVASHCAAVKCGSPPTPAQVAQAVATYCRSDGRCRGPSGPSGAIGTPGKSGPPGSPGAPGQNATADQVADAVATYCAAHDDCRGEQGSSGEQGPSGPAGAPGSAGPTGAPGDDGQPPISWTYTDALGRDHTCTRTDPFDASAPTYSCD